MLQSVISVFDSVFAYFYRALSMFNVKEKS